MYYNNLLEQTLIMYENVKFFTTNSHVCLLASCNKNEATLSGIKLDVPTHGMSTDLDTFTVEGYHQGILNYLSNEGITVNYISSDFDSQSRIMLCLSLQNREVIEINVPRKHKRKLKN